MKSLVQYAALVLLLIMMHGCTLNGKAVSQQISSSDARQLIPQLENGIAERLFQQAYDEILPRYPERQSCLGTKSNNQRWTDRSPGYAAETLETTHYWWRKISHDIDYTILSDQNKLGYQLFAYNFELANGGLPFRFDSCPSNHSISLPSSIVLFLINIHPAASVTDLEAYITRLKNAPVVIQQFIDYLKEQEQLGFTLPESIIRANINESLYILSGRPFEFSKQDNILLADFKQKLDKLGLIDSKKQQLLADTSTALIESIKPAYSELISYLQLLKSSNHKSFGIWNLPGGDDLYLQRLHFYTGTDMKPDQIHKIGLVEVNRIRKQMRVLLGSMQFDGDLSSFIRYLREDSSFYFPDSEQGRQAYLSGTVHALSAVNQHLDELFYMNPNSDLIVKAVESFHDESAAPAFYIPAAANRTRPGIFYVNLRYMRDMPKYQLEALAYQYGIPGQHLQNSITLQLEGISEFQRFGSFQSYSDGWGLYAVRTAGQTGLFSDPYAHFGGLALELQHAGELVTDTGIHWLRWSREQAIGYLDKNTAANHAQNIRTVDKQFVHPGLATAATIGVRKFLDLEQAARDNLGANFDIREFHQALLVNGPLPPDFLEIAIKEWIANNKG